MPHKLDLDSPPQSINGSDPGNANDLLVDLLVYGPEATREEAEYAQARVNAYVHLRACGLTGNPLDPNDMSSFLKI